VFKKKGMAMASPIKGRMKITTLRIIVHRNILRVFSTLEKIFSRSSRSGLLIVSGGGWISSAGIGSSVSRLSIL